MSALDLWRERCIRHIASARWLPWRRRNVSGLRKALSHASCGCESPLHVEVSLAMYSVFYLPDWRPGLDLAGKWLREAIDGSLVPAKGAR